MAVDEATETRGELRARLRLRQQADDWFPDVDPGVLDRVVASGWLEARDQAGAASSKRIAIVAAAAVRRDGLRALRGERLALPKDAEERITALSAEEPLAQETQQRRRAHPEALGRRAATPSEPDPATQARPVALKRDHPGEEDPPPTRRRRGRRSELQGPLESTPDPERETGSRTMRILAETATAAALPASRPRGVARRGARTPAPAPPARIQAPTPPLRPAPVAPAPAGGGSGGGGGSNWGGEFAP